VNAFINERIPFFIGKLERYIMVKVLKKKKEERLERILNAAFKLFKEQGYSKTSMKDIASAADLGVGTLYNYFPSKSDIIIKLNDSMADVLFLKVDKYLEFIRNGNGEPQDLIKKVIDEFMNLMLELGKQFLQEIFAAFFTSKQIMEKGIDLDMKMLLFLQQVMKIFMEKGQIDKDLEIKEASYILYGVITSNIMYYVFLKDIDKDSIIRSLHKQIEILFKGFKICDNRRQQ
jgi:AcrR family transcriptional regulator